MTTKHMIIDQNGVEHKRVSVSRVYSHAIVVYMPATPGNEAYPNGWPAETKVSWASSRALAEKEAGAYRARGYKVEILVANHM